MKKIALEEHFMLPECVPYWEATVAGVPAENRANLLARLVDFDDMRLAEMDAAGVDMAVLALAGPGVQVEPDTATATRVARVANDFLAENIARHPARYAGFAHLAMQDPAAAADELERCVRQLGFKGAMINGQTHGRYLDEDACAVLWERAADLNAPIYLHPADPEALYAGLQGHPHLTRATWGWTVETATHALRMVFGGVFERFPKARLVLGHMGETLPYLLWRLDGRTKLYAGYSLPHPPSFYIKRNFAITTSGQCAIEPLECALASLGVDKVMFAIDYPFESSTVAGSFIDSVALPEATRAAICHGNAAALLGL